MQCGWREEAVQCEWRERERESADNVGVGLPGARRREPIEPLQTLLWAGLDAERFAGCPGAGQVCSGGILRGWPEDGDLQKIGVIVRHREKAEKLPRRRNGRPPGL